MISTLFSDFLIISQRGTDDVKHAIVKKLLWKFIYSLQLCVDYIYKYNLHTIVENR